MLILQTEMRRFAIAVLSFIVTFHHGVLEKYIATSKYVLYLYWSLYERSRTSERIGLITDAAGYELWLILSCS